MLKRICSRWTPALLVAVMCVVMAVVAQAQSGTPPQDEFVPISQLPAQDQLPAAPLLIGAYAFVWAALCAYVISLARRVSAVQRDVARLEDVVTRGRR